MSRYDGATFTTFTTADGLAGNGVSSIFQDRERHLWFGTGGGVNRYDGATFTTFTTTDGLAGNGVGSIFQDREGLLWFGTSSGVTRYRPPQPVPPPAFIDAVVADRRYEGVNEVTISSNVGLVASEFHGRSFKTRPEAMVYRYRLRRAGTSPAPTGIDEWKNTNARRVEYEDLPPASYTFEVLVVDRDLVYSETPATVHLRIVPPWYLNGWIMFPSGGGFLGLLFVAFYFGKRLQTQRAIAQQFNPYIARRQSRGTGSLLRQKRPHHRHRTDAGEQLLPALRRATYRQNLAAASTPRTPG